MSNIGNITFENDGDDDNGKCPRPRFDIHFPEHDCVPLWIRIGQLAQKTGLTTHTIRKWTKEGLIPYCKRPREHVKYPGNQAVQAVEKILRNGGLK